MWLVLPQAQPPPMAWRRDIPADCPPAISCSSIQSFYSTRITHPPPSIPSTLSLRKATADILHVCLPACVCAKYLIYSQRRGHLPSFYHFQSVSLCATSPPPLPYILPLSLSAAAEWECCFSDVTFVNKY